MWRVCTVHEEPSEEVTNAEFNPNLNAKATSRMLLKYNALGSTRRMLLKYNALGSTRRMLLKYNAWGLPLRVTILYIETSQLYFCKKINLSVQ